MYTKARLEYCGGIRAAASYRFAQYSAFGSVSLPELPPGVLPVTAWTSPLEKSPPPSTVIFQIASWSPAPMAADPPWAVSSAVGLLTAASTDGSSLSISHPVTVRVLPYLGNCCSAQSGAATCVK